MEGGRREGAYWGRPPPPARPPRLSPPGQASRLTPHTSYTRQGQASWYFCEFWGIISSMEFSHFFAPRPLVEYFILFC